MRYALMIYVSPDALDALPADERDAVLNGHRPLQKRLAESGELVSFHAWGQRDGSSLVRVRDDRTEVTDGPYHQTEDFLGGYYVVECASAERAIELAAAVPDARVNVVEVRPIPYVVGPDVNQ